MRRRRLGSLGDALFWVAIAFFTLNTVGLLGAYLIPLLVPPITYGIPLATVLYKYDLGGSLAGVILANLVPAVPFVILVMTPFIEQIDPNLEAAALLLLALRWVSPTQMVFQLKE